jgi:regulator of protease activity HflC (stomatin/prohibitin superfamily)
LIKPLLENWGVKVINFQIESIKLTDEKYGMEYEAASLEIAKAKANLKANVAKNEINISRAEMEAKALLIKVEGEKNAKIVAAEGIAKAMTIEAQARNEASLTLQDHFSKDLLMMQEKVNFARELKATTLVISDQNGVAKNVVPMLNI